MKIDKDLPELETSTVPWEDVGYTSGNELAAVGDPYKRGHHEGYQGGRIDGYKEGRRDGYKACMEGVANKRDNDHFKVMENVFCGVFIGACVALFLVHWAHHFYGVTL